MAYGLLIFVVKMKTSYCNVDVVEKAINKNDPLFYVQNTAKPTVAKEILSNEFNAKIIR